MNRTDVVIIGAGHAGLAMSHHLTERGIEHVVLERGRIAERWRSERWDSLQLLTPRWQSRLPGWTYSGPDPGGFMGRDELIRHLNAYARSFTAPVETRVTVTSVERSGEGFCVGTDHGLWRAGNVVVATGWCARPSLPALASRLSPRTVQRVANGYRNPEALPEGGVLVVGASSTGVQLAAEIQRSGRPVTLAVGRHSRAPRRYRGRDIMEWLDAMGVLQESLGDRSASPLRTASFQLIGSDDHRTLDLPALHDLGVRLAGRVASADQRRISFASDLSDHTAEADARLQRMLARIDGWIAAHAVDAPVDAPFRRLAPAPAIEAIDLEAEGIRTVLWATGYRREYPWLRIPVFDPHGDIRHRGGVTEVPGLYVLGMLHQRSRNSSFLDGAGADALVLARQIERRVGRAVAAVA